jgi:arylsulfatase A-like enzyme
MIAVPILVALCALSYGRAREISMRSALPNPPNSPNVLVIIVDSLRADHLSPYGYSRDTSPYVNQLAQQGVLFENAVAPSSWTLPSHASMLTGLYPHEAHVELEKDDLSANLPTLGEAMGKAGYRTAAFSANYFMFSRDHGFMHGFSHFEGYEQSAAGILEKIPLSEFIFTKLSHLTTGVAGAFFGLKNAAGADKISEDALDWIAQGRRPFFVVLNYFDVHDPVMPPATYQHIYTTNADARNQSMHFEENCDSEKALCNKERQQFIDTYDGSMRFVDDSVRHLLSQLNQLGMLQNTIVVFTSDHGQEFGDHGFFGHEKSLYRQEIQVPLIVWRPGSIPASVRITTPVSLTDLPATVLDLVSPEQMKTLPGRSLAELWRSSEPASEWHNPMPELARLHWFDKDAPNYNGPVRSIVTPDWQYIRQQGKDLLFDWKADPAEANDLCASQPVVCADLRTQLQSEEAGHQ